MRRLLILLCIVIYSVDGANAQGDWQAISGAPRSWRLDDIFFLTPLKGWAINPYYTVFSPRQFARIIKTDDGGRS